MNIDELIEKRDSLLEEGRAIVAKADEEGRDITEEEAAKVDALTDEAEKLAKDINRRQKLDAEPVQRRSSAKTPKPANKPEKEERYNFKRFAHQAASIRHSNYFKNNEEHAYATGLWLSGVLGNRDAAKAFDREYRDHTTTVNDQGGYLVPEFTESAVLELREEVGVLRRYANVVDMPGETLNINRVTQELSVEPVSQNVETEESSQKWDQVKLVVSEWAAYATWPKVMNDRTLIRMADSFVRSMGFAFAEKEDQVGFIAAGQATYDGKNGLFNKILGTSSAINAASGVDTFGEITNDDLNNLIGALPQYAEADAAFYCSKRAAHLVFARLFQDQGGASGVEMANAMPMTYMGYPIRISQVLPSGATTDYSNAAMLAFGDLRQSIAIGDLQGLTIETSNDAEFKKRRTAIQGVAQFDVNVHTLEDPKGNGAGPVVALIGN